MRNITEKHRTTAAGFTRTELFVLLGVGALLSSVLGADLNQAKSKLLQQACAANLKQWGMAIDLYTQDYNGTYYYLAAGSSVNFDDNASPYLKYLGGGNPQVTMRTIRCCPAIAARMTQGQLTNSSVRAYSIPIPEVFSVGSYIDFPGDFFGNLCPTLRYLKNPSQYLLMIDSGGHTLDCGNLVGNTSGANSIPSGDTVRAVDRHGGAVNCLFGDFHVELVSQSAIAQHATNCGSNPDPWFLMKGK